MIANTLETLRTVERAGFPLWGRVWGYPHGVKDVVKWVRAASNKRTNSEQEGVSGAVLIWRGRAHFFPWRH
jgi:hypothetical protein